MDGRQVVGPNAAQARYHKQHQGCNDGIFSPAAAQQEMGVVCGGVLVVHGEDYNTEKRGQIMLYYVEEMESMDARIEKGLDDIKERLVRELNPQQIILFGSYAYGRPTADSDVDLLIVMDSNDRPVARAARVSKLLRPRPFPIDILVRTPEEIRYRLKIGDLFVREIFERGKVLYDQRVYR